MLYKLTKPILFSLDPEIAHELTFKTLKIAKKFRLLKNSLTFSSGNSVRELGIKIKNPIGLAAGLDKNGEYLDVLDTFGFGLIEIGTVTPKGQPGNPKPRLFRLTKEKALINRMGFNNQGVDEVLKNVRRSSYAGILGINIGKNKDTPIHLASEDYLYCMRKAYSYADYITINISSPNTNQLRSLQNSKQLNDLISVLTKDRDRLEKIHKYRLPLVVKIAPDLQDSQMESIAKIVKLYKVDGIIATNTTLNRQNLKIEKYRHQEGGVSGKPLKVEALHTVAKLHQYLSRDTTIIGSGGIMSAEDAKDMFDAGANLIQIYSGLIYEGPSLVKDISESLKNKRS